MSLLGYARVSTADQSLRLQTDALKEAGCSRIFSDHNASGTRADRPALLELLDYARAGDVVVVWRLDRLARSVRDLISLVDTLDAADVDLRSLKEHLDTGSPGGRLIFHVFASLAEFEADLTSERTKAGLAAAKARGRKGGRPTVMTPDKLAAAQALHASGDLTLPQIATQLGIGRSTLVSHLARARTALPEQAKGNGVPQ